MEEDSFCTAALTFGTYLDHFAESEEVFSLVAALPEVCKDLRSRETSRQRFTVILDAYQAQPHLLDSHLERLVSELFQLTSCSDDSYLRHQAFCYLYVISKVRGAKILARWFPHEVSDLEPALKLLSKQDPSHTETWEVRYVLLLWLAVLVLVPFDLSRMDGDQVGVNGHTPKMIDRLYDVAKLYIGVKDTCRDAAALLMTRFITRPDVKEVKMEEFVRWSLDILEREDDTYVPGVLRTLTSLFKHAKRDDVVGVAPAVLRRLCRGDLQMTFNIQQRKSFIKLVQWVGVVFLPPRIAKWRYQRGGRSLEEALGSTHTTPLQTEFPTETETQEDYEDGRGYDIPAEVEEVLGFLLLGLQDGHTIVRWPAAKGVGRVTGRLPRALADEVVLSLLDLFKSRENDVAWHGGCLALAELGRRGLLLPQRLREVVPVVVKALAYDERRGSYSVGAPVRDAACYVSWSFARAYCPEELLPYVQVLASALLVTMLFDREVQCRRAASAAFQENVGRIGNFPHGIEILTLADYFALGSRSNAYLNVSVQVASFSEYCRPLVEHLVQFKISHWDLVIRELAAQALHNLTPLDSSYMRNEVLVSMLPLVTSTDPCVRHGALHVVAELIHSFWQMAQEKNSNLLEVVGRDITKQLLQVAPRLQEAGVFKGAIGEMMRPAALKFIENICTCQVDLSISEQGEEILGAWQAIVEDNFAHTEETIQVNAVSAFGVLCESYYCTDAPTICKFQAHLIDLCTKQLNSHSHFSQMGYALAMGALPKQLLVGKGVLRGKILDPLMKSCTAITETDPRFTEARKCAVTSITRLCCTVDVAVSNGNQSLHPCGDAMLEKKDVEDVFDCLFTCLGDYTINRRGDIGAVVREAAVTGLFSLTSSLLGPHPALLNPHMMEGVVCGLVQQSNEKIDRTRALACEKLVGVVYHQPCLPHIPHHQHLQEIFKEMSGSEVNYATPQLTFPMTVQLLGISEYRDHTLLGLIVSVGGLTESTVRESGVALLNFLRSLSRDSDTLLPFSESIVKIMRDHAQESRLITPLFKTLDFLFSNGIFDIYNSQQSHPFPEAVFELSKAEVKGCKDPVKLLACVNVFCGLTQFLAVRKKSLSYVMYLLGHAFPKVRKSTADQFYLCLMTFDDLVEEETVEEVTAILSETAWLEDWDSPLAEVRPRRNNLCELLQLPIPKLLVRPGGNKFVAKKDNMDSYRDLVDRAGY